MGFGREVLLFSKESKGNRPFLPAGRQSLCSEPYLHRAFGRYGSNWWITLLHIIHTLSGLASTVDAYWYLVMRPQALRA